MQTSKENWFFFKQWSKHPFRLGTCFPISKAFAGDVVSIVKTFIQPDDLIIELGSGTGRLTGALVENGFENIISVELDKELASFLSQRFKNTPQVRSIIQGDAALLREFLPDLKGKVPIIISVLPLMYFPHNIRKNIVDEIFHMLDTDGICLHVCYTPISPLKKEDYCAKKVYTRFRHSPPGFVWRFSQKQAV